MSDTVYESAALGPPNRPAEAVEFRGLADRAAHEDTASTQNLVDWVHAEQQLNGWNALTHEFKKDEVKTANGHATELIFTSEDGKTIDIKTDGHNHVTVDGKTEAQIRTEEQTFLKAVNESRLSTLPDDVRGPVLALESALIDHDGKAFAQAAKTLTENGRPGEQIVHQLDQDLILAGGEAHFIPFESGGPKVEIEKLPDQVIQLRADGEVYPAQSSTGSHGYSMQKGVDAIADLGQSFRDNLASDADNRHARYFEPHTAATPAELGERIRTSL